MDVFMIIMRLFHVVSGAFWVGWGVYMLLFMLPVVQELGQEGGKVMSALLRVTPWAMAMPTVAGLTMLSGILMYGKVSDGFNADWMKLTSSIVLSIGAVAGIAGGLHGGATVGRASSRMKVLITEMGSNPPNAEQAAELAKLRPYIAQHARISTIIVVFALACMATFRYF